MSTFLYERGEGAKRRVMHLAHYNAHGVIDGTWCGSLRFNTSINLPLGRRVCKTCLRWSSR